mmetsp:Transcript_1921/g.2916  ORF Transcript_1921/g.2916 Transcript_1921/m.2916 type:complete len:1032 (+) Transcript_1921:416-3511(+)|eukprot:CAMPEP_0184651722 /NCGR_PEP_ID=MMETSP0308-20130426/9377_1 /TAXON_ID=38269 /ORGANISM="Gloeochaete witrockiana, Strain SAG 46.84" /LENGTH=1031 /DNA_ID=CAMNT_0027086147 /DNA_START=363 /DNA_END=3458 /DNA_ORIENTATION=+
MAFTRCSFFLRVTSLFVLGISLGTRWQAYAQPSASYRTGFVHTHGAALFFYFVPNSDPSAALIVHVGGGFACSSLASAFFEGGPYLINGDSVPVQNAFALSQKYAVLYLEQNVEDGFSYVADSTYTDPASANDEALFLSGAISSWLAQNPSEASRPLYLYVSFLTVRALPAMLANLQKSVEGIIVSAGVSDMVELVDATLRFYRYMSLVEYWQLGPFVELQNALKANVTAGNWAGSLNIYLTLWKNLDDVTGGINHGDARMFDEYNLDAINRYVLPMAKTWGVPSGVTFKTCRAGTHLKVKAYHFQPPSMTLLQQLPPVKVLLVNGRWSSAIPSEMNEYVFSSDAIKQIARAFWKDTTTQDLVAYVKQSSHIGSLNLFKSVIMHGSGRWVAHDMPKQFMELVQSFVGSGSGKSLLHIEEHVVHRPSSFKERMWPVKTSPLKTAPLKTASLKTSSLKTSFLRTSSLSEANHHTTGSSLREPQTRVEGPLRTLIDLPDNDQSGNEAALCVPTMPGTAVPPTIASPCAAVSGYMTVPSSLSTLDLVNLAFIFFEAESGDKTSPIVIWLQGGPGCSSMYGLFTECGPYTIRSDDTLEKNPYRWNKQFGTMFIDQPVGTGMSIASNNNTRAYYDIDAAHGPYYVFRSEQGADDFFNSLVQFFKKFPNWSKRPIYLAGESYAGKYTPLYALRIIQGNQDLLSRCAPNDPSCFQINLQGIVVCNPWTAPIFQLGNFSAFALSMGLIDKATFEKAQPREKVVQEYLLRTQLSEAANEDNSNVEGLVYQFSGAIDAYNIQLGASEGEDPPQLGRYLNDPEVQLRLHWTHLNWQGCNNPPYYALEEDVMRSANYAFSTLLTTPGFRVLIYSGNTDSVCPSPLTSQFIDQINWVDIDQFRKAPRKVWNVDGKPVGYWQEYGPLARAVVHGAGHMVPAHRPVAALDLVQHFVLRSPISLVKPPTFYANDELPVQDPVPSVSNRGGISPGLATGLCILALCIGALIGVGGMFLWVKARGFSLKQSKSTTEKDGKYAMVELVDEI